MGLPDRTWVSWLARSPARPARAARHAALAAAFLLAVEFVFDTTLTHVVDGVALGSLYGIIAVALILTYRTLRIINFAAAAVGAIPAIVALMLVLQLGVNYLIALPVALIGGPLFGVATDLLVMRWFARSPRLIATVVTIGIAQSVGALGFFIPVWFGAKAGQIATVPTPWQDVAVHDDRGQAILGGNQVFAFVVMLALAGGLAVFLRRSRYGIALRASAENADRAALLGIPVQRVRTVAWALAGLLAATAIFAQAPLIGVPSDATLGFDTLLYGLAAAVVGRMDRMGVALGAGMGIGVLIFESVSTTGTNDKATALMLAIILAAFLLQRRQMARALADEASTWQVVRIFRPMPAELRAVPEIVYIRVLLIGLGLAAAATLPYLVGAANLTMLTLVPLYGIVAVSLVVLTGWAGQISLGQFGLVGIGAAVAGGLVAKHNIDFFFAVALGVAAGAATAVAIGLPAIRIRGLYLAVITLAFGYAMQFYVLNPAYVIGGHLLPEGYTSQIVRPWLYGLFDLENDRNFYYVCVAFLLLSILAALSFRRNRSGRVLIAARDNERGAAVYSVNLTRARLAAFAISGGVAGMAGALFAYQQHNVIPDAYSVLAGIFVFLAATFGGLTSVLSAALITMAFEAAVLFGPFLYQALGDTFAQIVPLLLTGPLLLLNLYLNPAGVAEVVFEVRNRFLRRIARRHGIEVPSLAAERTASQQAEERQVMLAAERGTGHASEEASGAEPIREEVRT